MTGLFRPGVTRRSFVTTGLSAAGLTLLHPFSARAAAGQAHLRIMATTDIHVALAAYDYYADGPDDKVGLARTASLIAAVRAEAANSLLVDNGDFLQGNPLGDYMAHERGLADGLVHPVIRAMNLLGYDAGTLGNHEFNYGLDFLMAALAGARFPVVSANLAKAVTGDDPRKDATHLKPYALLERKIRDGAGAEHTIRIGVIGFLPPQIMVWDSQNLAGKAATRDIVATAKAWVPEMKEAGADIIIALCHSGIDTAIFSDGMENAALYLAGIDGIDAIVTGHQHLVFPGPKDFKPQAGLDPAKGTLQGKPAVMAGFWGSHLGLIDLLLEERGGRWAVAGFATEARPIYHREDRKVIADVADRADIVETVRAEHEATLAYVRRPVGRSATPLSSFFALVADDASVQIVNQAQLWYAAPLLAGTRAEGLPLLSAAAPFKSGGRGGPDYYTNVPAGDLAIKNVADLYLYPNTVRVVVVSAGGLREWLEMAAGLFNRIEPGSADGALINPDFPAYNFDVIDGVSYEIDVSQPARYDANGKLADAAANRIRNLTFEGRPVEDTQSFAIVTNNYRAGGGGNFPGLGEDRIVLSAPDTNRDVLVRYIMAQGTVKAQADGNWRFAPLPGTTALFQTGPAAREKLAAVTATKIEPAGEGKDGYAQFRLFL